MKIYVASSWRNQRQPEVVKYLREAGHEVYDFKNPPNGTGFDWSAIDPNWQSWTNIQYMQALADPIAQAGFDSDFNAMAEAEVCVLVLPCNRSAHSEAGFMQGQGKKVIVLLAEEPEEPELMYRMYTGICEGFFGLSKLLIRIEATISEAALQINIPHLYKAYTKSNDL